MAILLQSVMGNFLQIAQIFRNTQVSKNQTEARRAEMNQTSNILGVVPSHGEKENP